MRLFAIKKYLAAVAAIILFLSVFAVCGTNGIFAIAQSTDTVTLYSDTQQQPYAVIEIIDGSFTLPEAPPYKEGFTFQNWSDGLASYQPGSTYEVADSLELYAVWKEEVTEYQREPLFNQTEKVALYTLIGVLALILVFCYYWFGIKERSLKQLGEKIKSFFIKK